MLTTTDIATFHEGASAKGETIIDLIGPHLPDSGTTDEARQWCVGLAMVAYSLVGAAREEVGASQMTAETTLSNLGRLIDLMTLAGQMQTEPTNSEAVEPA